MNNKNIVVIFVLLLLASIVIMPVASQSSIPIELALTAEPSTITVGETSTVTVRLLDENGKPIKSEADIHINLSATCGYVNPSMVIPAGTDLSSTEFTSKNSESEIVVISARSRGLIYDTVSIAVVSTPMLSPSEMATSAMPESVGGGEYLPMATEEMAESEVKQTTEPG